MPAIDEQIGGCDYPAVRRRQHRGVVADADHGGRVRRQQRVDLGYQPKLAEIGNANDGLPARASGGAYLR